MNSAILIVSVFVAFSSAQDIVLKAPSLAVNCGCQCDNYIFNDAQGNTLGNCNSVDDTGARWCYVAPGNTCTDTRRSQRRDGFGRFRRISYEACATPRCGGGIFGGNTGIGGGFGNNGNGGFGNNNNGGFGGGFGNNGNGGFGGGLGNNGNGGFGNKGNGGFGSGFNGNNNGRVPSNGQISITNILRPRKNKGSSSSKTIL